MMFSHMGAKVTEQLSPPFYISPSVGKRVAKHPRISSSAYTLPQPQCMAVTSVAHSESCRSFFTQVAQRCDLFLE